MDGNCPRCAGIFGRRWDVAVREWEVYCVLCGHMPKLRLVRADGKDLGAPQTCIECHLRPVARVGKVGKAGHRELRHCAGCREKINRRARILEQWRKKKKVVA